MKRRIAVCDCETDPFKIGRVPEPFVWGYFDGEMYLQFTDTVQFVKFLSEQYVICYAHNGGKFDWHFLLPYLSEYDDLMIINGRIAKCYFGSAECRDSYNILPVPLAAYKKDKIDYAIMEKDVRYKPENWRKISAYLKSDCVYLHELIIKFVDLYGVQITQASAAMQQWKKVSQQSVPHSTKEFYDTLSPYYYGGRVECFKAGVIEEKFSVFDINSAYPYAMLQEHPYSTEFSHVEHYVKGADFYRLYCRSSGAFPFRGLGGGSNNFGLHFPNDNEIRDYTITGWEYNAAIDTKTISDVKVVESFSFAKHVNFREYIEHFYEMRLKAKAEKNEAESLFAKLLMNSLYGKFAANPENYRNYMIVPMDVIPGLESQGWTFCGELGCWGLAEAPIPESEQRYYNVATGASITGFVRAMLLRAISTSKGVLYCDTDSVAVKKPGAAVQLGEEIGAWKLEGEFDRAGIAGKKLYIFRGADGWWKNKQGETVFAKVKPKGGERLYKAAAKGAKLTHSQLWQVARGRGVEYLAEVPTFSVNKAPVFTNRRIKFTA